MKKLGVFLFLAAMLCGVVMNKPAQAMIIWGYDNTPAAQKKYQLFAASSVNGCVSIQRNMDPSFILAPDIHFLTGIGTRVVMSSPTCIQSMDHVNVALVTPKHILVTDHLNIWNQAHIFAFVGTDHRVYLARSKPGVARLSNMNNTGVQTGIGLVELENELPAAVVPLHVANFSARHVEQLKDGMTYYSLGNLHRALNYDLWRFAGDAHTKAIGTNILRVSPAAYFGYSVSTEGTVMEYLQKPANQNSQNWQEYWRSDLSPLPAAGTAFVRDGDMSSPSLVRLRDSSGQVRPHVMALHVGYNAGASTGFVFNDLLMKIAAYNQVHGTRYSINNAPQQSAQK